ncbi:uncharacterized protein PGRI_038890 [Penicillium griseofulvum]|uniref:Uncharacterized protein n=1 Tax=Penicillium patulum TaxID=5078 RepID=A0A135LDW7_PENPA|nr:uncharacterized protein PGRI_038890 [Penicillium griseofulvum]KXG47143.1 hypothetical protein PGRI_038890 [Penicillium griseofulvum]
MESWAFVDLVDAAASKGWHAPQREHPVQESRSHVSHGYSNSTDFVVLNLGTDIIVRPGLVDDMPPWFPTPFLVPIPVSLWTSDGVTSSVPEEDVDIDSLLPGPGLGFIAKLLLVCVWWLCQASLVLIAYERQLFSDIETMMEGILKVFEGQLQIARVQFVAEEDSSFDKKMDLLIAGSAETDEEALLWVMAADSCPESVSHVSVLSQSGGIWVHRITKGLGDEQAPEPESECNTTKPASTTDDVRENLVSRHPWNSIDLYASDSDDSPAPAVSLTASDHDDSPAPAESLTGNGADGPPAPAESLTSNGAEDERPDSTPAYFSRKNRPSQAKRRRAAKRAQQEKKELQHSNVLASYASRASLAMPPSSTPLSALAPVFVPGHLAEQGDSQSGPLSPAPLFANVGIDPPTDCGTTLLDDNALPQQSRRRRRRRQHHA